MTRSERAGDHRLPAVAGGVALAALVLAVRLVWLGTAAADDLGAVPRSPIRPQRGVIWDRDGALLALESYAYDLGAATNEVADPVEVAAAISPFLGMDDTSLRERLSNVERQWVPLARGLDALSADRLASLELEGVYLLPEPRRHYPVGAAAGHVTGFVDFQGEAYYGVEAAYDDELSGTEGDLAGINGTDPTLYRPPMQGADLILTIDNEIQLAASAALEAAIDQFAAVAGTILVLEPRTGGILASTSLPAFDPNDVVDADPTAFADPAISAQYEPGSAMKAMTMAAALETGVVRADSTYEDTGTVEIAGLTVANWDRLAHGRTSMTELLTYSLNVGAVHLSQQLGPDRFYDYLRAFGYGEPTGVDLFGEVGGQVHFPDEEASWYSGNLATNSFGQGLAATPLQVATAFGALANNGVLIAPRIVAATVTPEGVTEPMPMGPSRRVVSPGTARTLRGMLQAVVDDRVTKAAIPGYSVAGKTGTSQIPIEGGYDPDSTIASFVGMLPVESPQVVILVKIDRPSTPRGSDVAAPAFREVAEVAIRVLGIEPDKPVWQAGAP